MARTIFQLIDARHDLAYQKFFVAIFGHNFTRAEKAAIRREAEEDVQRARTAQGKRRDG